MIDTSEALYALADMVNQFAYRAKYYGKEALQDGGLSALENAFWVLEKAGCKMNKNGTIQVENLFEFMEMLEMVSNSPCPYYCYNKTEFGYCKTSVCINSEVKEMQMRKTGNTTGNVTTVIHKNYTKNVINHICGICGESQYKDSYYETTDFWLCPECAKKIGKLIGVRTED